MADFDLVPIGEVVSAPAFDVVETRTDRCGQHGPYRSELVRGVNAGVWLGCPQCDPRPETQRPEGSGDRLEKRLASAGVPKRFADCTLGNFNVETDDQSRAIEAARWYTYEFTSHAKVGRCLVFCGAVGTGKTHLAVGILRELADQGRSVSYVRALEAIRSVRDTWRSNSERSERKVIAEYIAADLLVLDEVGLQYGTEGERVILTEIIGGRYDQVRPTVVISNEDTAGLRKYLGPRAFDRLRGSAGRLVVFDWDSWRGSAGGVGER